MFKFFVNKKKDNYFILDDDIIKHIKVARIIDQKIICIYENQFYVCQLKDNKAKIINKLKNNNEFNGNVVLGASILAKKRFDLLIQKATELGVKKIIPVFSQNVAFKITDLEKSKKRWQIIAQNAAQQSFRNLIPEITTPFQFEKVLEFNFINKFIAHQKNNHNNILLLPTDAFFLVGPEGGFTDKEVKMALNKNFKMINLGKRILRSETAAMFILSRINEPSVVK